MEIPPVSGPACVRCGEPLPQPGEVQIQAEPCRACRVAPPQFERAVAYGAYQARMREAIHALKYDGMYPAAKRLGCMLAQAILKLSCEAPAEMIVLPVPLHRSKKRQRGFNQARALAEQAIAELHKSHPNWKLKLAAKALMRVRATETQAGLSPRQRRLNVRSAFQVPNPQAVRGRDVLLIDDILTTGATARAASLALKRAGAKSVWVATLARAGREFPARVLHPIENGDHGTRDSTGTSDTPANEEMHSSVEFI